MRRLTEQEEELYLDSLRKQRDQYPDDSEEHRHNRELINRMARYAMYRTTTDKPLTYEQYVSPNQHNL